MNYSPILSPETLNELVRRIVEAVHPRRILLFGSAARGEMGQYHKCRDRLRGAKTFLARHSRPFWLRPTAAL
jgi:hypothetical protein